MPNTGRPSQDCHLCRARRVKCDLSKPACSRCINYGAQCPGYREEADLLFRNETAGTVIQRTQRKPRRRTGSRDPSSSPPTSSSVSSSSSAVAAPRRRSPSPTDLSSFFVRQAQQLRLRQVADPDRYRAVSLVLVRLMTRAAQGAEGRGWLEFLPGLFLDTPDASCLFLVADLFAAALAAPGEAKQGVEQVKLYGRAIRGVNEALGHATLCKVDGTLASVWLLSHYEILISSRQTGRIPAPDAWHAHSQGLIGLLRLRGKEQFDTERGRIMFWIMLSIIQVRCMIGNVEFPPETRAWLSQIRAVDTEPPLVHHTFFYGMEAAVLIARTTRLLSAGTPDEVCLAFPSVLIALAAIEHSEAATTLLGPDGADAAHAREMPYVYFLNAFRAARLKLHYQVASLATVVADLTRAFPALALLGVLPDQDEFRAALVRQRRASIATAREMARRVVATARHNLDMAGPADAEDSEDGGLAAAVEGTSLSSVIKTKTRAATQRAWPRRTRPPIWTDGASTLWPVTLVARLPVVDPATQRGAFECLARIVSDLGIQQAKAPYAKPTAWQYDVGRAKLDDLDYGDWGEEETDHTWVT